MKLGMSPCVHPLINEHSHVLASDSKNGLSKYICADQHMTPQTTANLLLCCIWCQRKLLIEYLETVTVSEITTCCWGSHSSHLVCSLSLYWLSHHDCTMWSQVGGGGTYHHHRLKMSLPGWFVLWWNLHSSLSTHIYTELLNLKVFSELPLVKNRKCLYTNIPIVKPTRCTIFWVYWISLYMFRTVFPSIIRSSRLYIQHQVYVNRFIDCMLAYSQQKNVHLVGFTIEIYHDAWSHEHQMSLLQVQ